MESALLVLPTWRANDLEAVVPAVRDLAEETGRVAVLLVDAATRGVPPEACLPAAAVSALETALAGAGASVYRWFGDELLAEAFARVAVPV
jgi:hypothetical protein